MMEMIKREGEKNKEPVNKTNDVCCIIIPNDYLTIANHFRRSNDSLSSKWAWGEDENEIAYLIKNNDYNEHGENE